MPDPVNAAHVLVRAWNAIPEGAWRFVQHKYVRRAVNALLAYGGGDPAVIMPDGTLRRLAADAPGVQGWFLADPVVPE
jgi:hypothetical protein